MLNTNTTIKELTMFVDSGSDLTLLKVEFVNMNQINNLDVVKIVGVTEGTLKSLGSTLIEFYVRDKIFKYRVQIMDNDFPIAADGILGRDFLQEFGIVISYDDNTLIFNENLYLPICQYINQFQMYANSSTSREDELMTILENKIPEPFKKEILKICMEYSDIFALDDEPVTTNNFYTQEIALTDRKPVYIKQYRIPEMQKPEIERQVRKMLTDRVIEPSVSPYNNPILLVPKKSDTGIKNGVWL